MTGENSVQKIVIGEGLQRYAATVFAANRHSRCCAAFQQSAMTVSNLLLSGLQSARGHIQRLLGLAPRCGIIRGQDLRLWSARNAPCERALTSKPGALGRLAW